MQNLVEEAKRLKEHGQLDEAIAMLKRAIELNIDDGEAYFQLGVSYFDKQDYAEARKALRVAEGLEPGNGLIYYYAGRSCHAMGDREGVQSMCIRLIIVNPKLSKKLSNDTAQYRNKFD